VRLHHLAFRTRDLATLATFYERTLGLEVTKRDAGRVWLRAGDVVVMLEVAGDGEPAVPTGTRELVAFAVDPRAREVWVGRLQAAGVALEDRTEHTLYFRDPDGRRIGVSSYSF
jgi:catechol 2,3-dioxygenase-like lactoylglutathione lyase family enzyme